MPSAPNRQDVLDYLKAHPGKSDKRTIARGLKIKGEDRARLRQILKALEDEGVLTALGRKGLILTDTPPPTGIVVFERMDAMGDLIGRSYGADGPYGPNIIFAGMREPRGKPGDIPGVGTRALCKITQNKQGEWQARLIKTLKPHQPGFVGIYHTEGPGGMVQPAAKKMRDTYQIAPGDNAGAVDGDLVKCDIAPPGRKHYGRRRAVVKAVLGRADQAHAASLLALHAHDIPDIFDPEVLHEADQATPADVIREDLTHLPFITIDPADARDHDDAVFAQKLEGEKAGWRIYVAIADVAAFVKAHGALDKSAYKRGNSTYFPDRVVPMLPEILSADKCSLKAHQPRPVMVAEMQFSAKGAKTAHRFFRAYIKVAANLSYHQAQQSADGIPDDIAKPLMHETLEPLWAAWRVLEGARKTRAPLALNLPERKIILSSEGKVERIFIPPSLDAHRLIEEMMIQANICAAQSLEQAGISPLYRLHPPPSEGKLIALADFLKALKIKWADKTATTPSSFNQLLALHGEGVHGSAISEMVLRTQSRAIYAPQNQGHFGLNLKQYAHFTSPIRRYSDVIIHRALIGALGLGPEGLDASQLARLDENGAHLSLTERRSMMAERDAIDRYLAHFMADREGVRFSGRISGVAGSGLFIRLDETGAEGFIPTRTLSHHYWHYDETRLRLVEEKSYAYYGLGDPVDVRLREAIAISGGLIFEMISDAKPGERRDRSEHIALKPKSGAKKPSRARSGAKPMRAKKPKRG